MSNRLSTAKIAATTALVASAGALALAAPPSMAATKILPADIDANPRAGHLKNGTVTFKLASGASSKLKSAGGKFSAAGTGDVKGSTISFDVTEASLIDVTTMKGSIILDGSLSVKGRSKTAKLTKITVEPGIEKRVIAKLGGKSVELGSLKGGSSKFSRFADGTLSGAKFSLSASGAKKLNSATGGGFGAGSFATVGASITGTELPLANGTATMTMDPSLLKTLNDAGYSLSADAPATVVGPVITLPLTAGAFDPEGLSGRLSFDGKVRVGNGPKSIPLFGWRAAIGGGQNELYAMFNEGSTAAAVLANVDVSQLEIRIEGQNYTGVGGKLTLSKTATDILKQQFNVAIPAGTVMGTVDLAGQLSGK
ncbi:MAG: hypothetical protein Q7T55_26715 [Solirubrobacteraceae bacterium]|nr:hypothetical protein [Solirubrobacteraceae bacterium]